METVEQIVAIRNVLYMSFDDNKRRMHQPDAFEASVRAAEESTLLAFEWTVTELYLGEEELEPDERALFVTITKTTGLPPPITSVTASYEPLGHNDDVHILVITCTFANGNTVWYDLYKTGKETATSLRGAVLKNEAGRCDMAVHELPDRVAHDDAIMFMHEAIVDRFDRPLM